MLAVQMLLYQHTTIIVLICSTAARWVREESNGGPKDALLVNVEPSDLSRDYTLKR